jgi:hypothetical protein
MTERGDGWILYDRMRRRIVVERKAHMWEVLHSQKNYEQRYVKLYTRTRNMKILVVKQVVFFVELPSSKIFAGPKTNTTIRSINDN